MLSANASPEVNEFFQSIHEVHTFLVESKRRRLADEQKRLVLKPQLHALKLNLNTLVTNSNIPPAEKMEAFLEGATRLTDILNLTPQKGPLHEVRSQLNSLMNIAIINMTQYSGKDDYWRLQASANLLVRILSEIERIPEVPAVPNPDDPTFLERARVVFNILNTTAGVYNAVMSALDTIPEKHFIDWTNETFWHSKLLDDYLGPQIVMIKWETVDVSLEERFRRLWVQFNTIMGKVGLAQLYLAMFGEKWDPRIETAGLVEPTFAGVQVLTEEVILALKGFQGLVDQAYKKGDIPINNNPYDYFAFRNLVDNKTILANQLNLFNLLATLHDGTIPPEILVGQIDDLLSSFEWYLDYLVNVYPGSRQNFQFTGAHIQLLSVEGKKAIILHDYDLFGDRYNHVINEFNVLKVEEYPDVYLYLEIIRLWVSSKIAGGEEMLQSYEILTELRPHLRSKFREYMACSVLLALLECVRDGGFPQQANDLLEETYNWSVVEGAQTHLDLMLKNYMQQLRFILVDKSNPDTMKGLGWTLNPFDLLTWVVPDFRSVLGVEGEHPLYVPFNLLRYKVQWESMQQHPIE